MTLAPLDLLCRMDQASSQICWWSHAIPIGFGYLGILARTLSLPATIVSPFRICRDTKLRTFASVSLLDPNEVRVRSSTRSVPVPMFLLAPTFVEDYFTVILPSTLSSLSMPTLFLEPVICVYCAIDPAPPASCLYPVLLALKPLSFPSSCPGHHRLYLLCHLHYMPFLIYRSTTALSGYANPHLRRLEQDGAALVTTALCSLFHVQPMNFPFYRPIPRAAADLATSVSILDDRRKMLPGKSAT
jgi:hypothetical protein